MKPVFRYCLHRTFDGAESVVPIEDAEVFLRQRAIAHWRAMPMRKRMSEGAIEEAIGAAIEDAHAALRLASLRA